MCCTQGEEPGSLALRAADSLRDLVQPPSSSITKSQFHRLQLP